MTEGIDLANLVARFADLKKAEDIRILDLREVSTIADYFVICSAGSVPHLKAIRKEIQQQLKDQHDVAAIRSDGRPESNWVIIDYGDVMAHIFLRETRLNYSLEDLWSDAPEVEFLPAAPAVATA